MNGLLTGGEWAPGTAYHASSATTFRRVAPSTRAHFRPACCLCLEIDTSWPRRPASVMSECSRAICYLICS